MKPLVNLTTLKLPFNVYSDPSKPTVTDKGLQTLTNLTNLTVAKNRTITLAGIQTLTQLTRLDSDFDPRQLTHLTSLVPDSPEFPPHSYSPLSDSMI